MKEQCDNKDCEYYLQKPICYSSSYNCCENNGFKPITAREMIDGAIELMCGGAMSIEDVRRIR